MTKRTNETLVFVANRKAEILDYWLRSLGILLTNSHFKYTPILSSKSINNQIIYLMILTVLKVLIRYLLVEG